MARDTDGGRTPFVFLSWRSIKKSNSDGKWFWLFRETPLPTSCTRTGLGVQPELYPTVPQFKGHCNLLVSTRKINGNISQLYSLSLFQKDTLSLSFLWGTTFSSFLLGVLVLWPEWLGNSASRPRCHICLLSFWAFETWHYDCLFCRLDVTLLCLAFLLNND